MVPPVHAAARYSFIVMDLHHLLLAGLPAHSAVTIFSGGRSWGLGSNFTLEASLAIRGNMPSGRATD